MSDHPILPAAWRGRAMHYRICGGLLVGCGIIERAIGLAYVRNFVRPDRYSAVWVVRGGGAYHDERGTACRIEAGDVLHRHLGLTHRVDPDPDGRWLEFFLCLGPEAYAMLRAAGIVDPAVPRWRPGVDRGQVLAADRLLRRIVDEGPDGLPGLVADGLAWLAEAHRQHVAQQATGRDPLDRARDLLAERLADPLPPEAVARRLGLGYEAFRKAFTRRFGLAPAAWRRLRRIDRARELLAGGASVADTARLVGYADVFAFTKAFTRSTGGGPAAWRRSVRREADGA